MKPHELQGKTFNRLTVLGQTGRSTKSGDCIWLCQCSCGNTKELPSTNIKTGKTKSCGCLAKEIAKARLFKHGQSTTREYNTWHHMKQRCLDPAYKQYGDYGGRGITISKKWMKFENFLADMGTCPEDHFLDRIDNDKGYSKRNCRWVTRTVNNNNRRNSVKVNGMTITEVAEQLYVSRDVMKCRLQRNPNLFVDIHS